MPADAYNAYLPAGQPRRKVRDFLRDSVLGRFSRKHVSNWFGQDITRNMLAKGLIEPAREQHYTREDTTDGKIIPGWYRVAETGARFASKSLIKPLPRAVADRLIGEMLERARAINRDPAFLFYVSEISLFGSYLTDAQELGDIDVALEFGRRMSDPVKFRKAVVARARELAPDRYFYLASDEWSFLRNETRKALKNRNRYLQIIPGGRTLIDTPMRVIFSEKVSELT